MREIKFLTKEGTQLFEESLQATERFFRSERLAHLALLQNRLLRLNDLKGHR